MNAPPCHFLPSLETALPLCGEAAVLATYCTMNPLLVTCARCRRAKIDFKAPGSPVERFSSGSYPSEDMIVDPGARQAAKTGMSEGVLLGEVRRLARNAGYLTYHTHRSDRSERGWFDLACAKPGHPLLLAELKTQRGKLSKEQLWWYEAVSQATGVEAYIWRPSSLPEIVTLFRR